MTEAETVQRLFGTSEDGVLYLPGSIMRSANLKPGDKLRLSIDKDGLRVRKADANPPLGGQP